MTKEQHNRNTEIAPEVKLRYKIIDVYLTFINAHSELQTAFKINRDKIPHQVFLNYIKYGNSMYHLLYPYVSKTSLNKPLKQIYERIFVRNDITKENMDIFLENIVKAAYICGLIKIDQVANRNPLPLDIFLSDFIERWRDGINDD